MKGRVGSDLDVFAQRLQRAAFAMVLAAVSAVVLVTTVPDVIDRFDGVPPPTAQTVYTAIHAQYRFPDQERPHFNVCVPRKYRATWHPEPEYTDFYPGRDQCLDAVITQGLDVYEMSSEDSAASVVDFYSAGPRYPRVWRQSGRFVLWWHGEVTPAGMRTFEGMVNVADQIT